MGLARLRKLRKLVPIEYEYMARRAALKLVRVKHRSAFEQVYHCCVWKTASQWVRLVLSDPRVYAHSGLAPIVPPAGVAGQHQHSVFKAKRCLSPHPLYISHHDYELLAGAGRSAVFFVLRDPRDLCVLMVLLEPVFPSAQRNSMPETGDPSGSVGRGWSRAHGKGVQRRSRLSSLLHSRPAAARLSEVKLVRYEELTGRDQLAVWDDVLQHCDIRLPGETLRSVLDTYQFRKLSGGRAQGDEVRTEKYRKGVAGDWRNHFTARVAREFARWNGDLAERAGYAESSTVATSAG